jgi:hypothetical protein
MAVLLNTENRIAGTVKFDATVSIGTLAGFIIEMKSKSPDRWFDLHIRGAGGDGTHYIGFHYILADGEKTTHKQAVQKFLQYLREKLGTRPKQGKNSDTVPLGVMGWSISTVEVMI